MAPCPMNITPEEYSSLFNTLMGSSYQKERKRLQRLSKINGTTKYDYNGELLELERKHSSSLRDYKVAVLDWLKKEGKQINRAYVCKESNTKVWKVLYEDKDHFDYFGALEYRSLFNNVMSSVIGKKLAFAGPLSQPLVILKPRQLSDFHNSVVHKLIRSCEGAERASNSICFRVNSVYRENKGCYNDEVHLYMSQDPTMSATSCKEKSLYCFNKPFFLIHVEDWTQRNVEGLPTEYYSPSLTQYGVSKWMQNLTKAKILKGSTFVEMQVASAWDMLPVEQLTLRETDEVFVSCKTCRTSPQRLPLGHLRIKCRSCSSVLRKRKAEPQENQKKRSKSF